MTAAISARRTICLPVRGLVIASAAILGIILIVVLALAARGPTAATRDGTRKGQQFIQCVQAGRTDC